MTQNVKSDVRSLSSVGDDGVRILTDHGHEVDSKHVVLTDQPTQSSSSSNLPNLPTNTTCDPLAMPRVGSSASISSLTRRNPEIFENEAPSTASSRAGDEDLEPLIECQTPLTPRKYSGPEHNVPITMPFELTNNGMISSNAATASSKPIVRGHKSSSKTRSDSECQQPLWSPHPHGVQDDAESEGSVDSVEKWLSERNISSLSDAEGGQRSVRRAHSTKKSPPHSVRASATSFRNSRPSTAMRSVEKDHFANDADSEDHADGLEGLKSVHESNGNDHDNDTMNENENDDCSSDSSQHLGLMHSMQSMVSSPHFMEGAIAMYSQLDDTLSNINQLKQQQMRTLRRRRKRQQQRRRSQTDGTGSVVHLDDANDDGDAVNEEEKKEDPELHLNEHLAGIMQTLISSTTEMGSLLRHPPPHVADPDGVRSGDSSVIGGLMGKLTSSIAYVSYISVSAITPILYKMVEAVLVELYATLVDVIECYDPDPKNNILWRIIHKMNEIIEAIQGLMALSDCFYEIASDDDHESDPDTDHGGGGGGGDGSKIKKL